MRFDIITIFPNIFDSYFKEGMIRKATEQNLLQIHIHNLRDFSENKWKKVDDIPFGGGAGMVMTPQPIYNALQTIKKLNAGPVIYLSPKGVVLTHSRAKQWAKTWQKPVVERKIGLTEEAAHPGAILICGRYEGIDQRIIDLAVDQEISLGKYVLTGGELASMVLIDAVSRFVPGVLGDENSHQEDTFSRKLQGKKEYPHYTKPRNFLGKAVPDVLLSGNHAAINQWRKNHLT